jgi:SMI1 / KNR4 family (SUKH-1)
MPFPIDLDQVQRTEADLGTSFRKSFVARMLADNGGDVEIDAEAWSLNPFRDTGDRKRIKRTASDIVRETAEARKWPRFPPQGIAVASNGMGDHLVFLPDPAAPQRLQPSVFRWSHETGELDRVAGDFGDLE